MRGSIRRKYGSPSQIKVESIKDPIPEDNQVLVKVHATTVNRTDCANLTAKPFIMRFILGLFRPKQIILGTDFAGEIIQIGKKVQSFKIGDKVFGFKDIGFESQAEYMVASADDVYKIPNNISCKSAAASLEGAHYAYSFIHKTEIKAGQKVLINGATGGIGSALLQFVKQFDVHITATSNPKNIDLIKSLGANKIIDYTREDFADNTGEKYDFIFDAVGKSTFGKCKPLLSDDGIYISSELGPFAQNLFYSLVTPLMNSKKVIFPIPFSTQRTIPYIIERLKQGTFKPVIDREYSLANISFAYQYVLRGEKTGNVIVNM